MSAGFGDMEVVAYVERLTPTLSKGEGAKKKVLKKSEVKVLYFGEDLGEATRPVRLMTKYK